MALTVVEFIVFAKTPPDTFVIATAASTANELECVHTGSNWGDGVSFMGALMNIYVGMCVDLPASVHTCHTHPLSLLLGQRWRVSERRTPLR